MIVENITQPILDIYTRDQTEIEDAKSPILDVTTRKRLEAIETYAHLKDQRLSPFDDEYENAIQRDNNIAMIFRVDLVESVVWTDEWLYDWWLYILHMHPLFGLFGHKYHPLTLCDRILILACGISFALANTAAGKCPWWVEDLMNGQCKDIYEIIYKIIIAWSIAIYMLLVKQMLLCKCCLKESYSTQVCCGKTGRAVGFVLLCGCVFLVVFAFETQHIIDNRSTKDVFLSWLVNVGIAYLIGLVFHSITFYFFRRREIERIERAGGIVPHYTKNTSLLTTLESFGEAWQSFSGGIVRSISNLVD